MDDSAATTATAGKLEDNSSDDASLNKTRINKEQAMLNKIAQSNATVKSQQRGEKELSLSEKIDYLNEIYQENPLKILYRFGKYMDLEDLELFKESASYEIKFYIDKFKALLHPAHKKLVVKNRRFHYLKNVLRNSDYFDDQELKKRNPFLYNQYIGQYAHHDRFHRSEEKFSEFLFRSIDDKISSFKCDLEERAYEEEEFDEDSSDDEMDNLNELEDKAPLDVDEKNRLRQEFMDIVENEFLRGDADFDYSAIDNNEEYDNINDHDIEEHYFDEEEAQDHEGNLDEVGSRIIDDDND